jgi:hypothetical protein
MNGLIFLGDIGQNLAFWVATRISSYRGSRLITRHYESVIPAKMPDNSGFLIPAADF